MQTIPGTFENLARCSYDELCPEARGAIDAIVNSHVIGMTMPEGIAVMLLRFLGMEDAEAARLLMDARAKAIKH